MDVKTLQQVPKEVTAQAAGQADEEERKAKRDAKLVDVAHEAMREKAAKDSDTLDALIRMGWPYVQQENFRGRVRKKVWDVVGESFNSVNDEMVEDITERIVDAAESDQFYKKLFDEKK